MRLLLPVQRLQFPKLVGLKDDDLLGGLSHRALIGILDHLVPKRQHHCSKPDYPACKRTMTEFRGGNRVKKPYEVKTAHQKSYQLQ
jgi:hypothetical protein